jgi:hypothetical protein
MRCENAGIVWKYVLCGNKCGNMYSVGGTRLGDVLRRCVEEVCGGGGVLRRCVEEVC